jgi:hypothetical protein
LPKKLGKKSHFWPFLGKNRVAEDFDVFFNLREIDFFGAENVSKKIARRVM